MEAPTRSQSITTTHYPNGRRKQVTRRSILTNHLDGLQESWYENGNRNTTIEFKEGEKDGIFKKWREDGKMIRIEKYKNSKEHGIWISFEYDGEMYDYEYTYWFEGVQEDKEIFSSSTNLENEKELQITDGSNDKLLFVVKWEKYEEEWLQLDIDYYKEVDQIESIGRTLFVADRLCGKQEGWYKNGSKKYSKEYNIHGELHFKVLEWYENGNLKVDFTFRNGNPFLQQTEYYENENEKFYYFINDEERLEVKECFYSDGMQYFCNKYKYSMRNQYTTQIKLLTSKVDGETVYDYVLSTFKNGELMENKEEIDTFYQEKFVMDEELGSVKIDLGESNILVIEFFVLSPNIGTNPNESIKKNYEIDHVRPGHTTYTILDKEEYKEKMRELVEKDITEGKDRTIIDTNEEMVKYFDINNPYSFANEEYEDEYIPTTPSIAPPDDEKYEEEYTNVDINIGDTSLSYLYKGDEEDTYIDQYRKLKCVLGEDLIENRKISLLDEDNVENNNIVLFLRIMTKTDGTKELVTECYLNTDFKEILNRSVLNFYYVPEKDKEGNEIGHALEDKLVFKIPHSGIFIDGNYGMLSRYSTFLLFDPRPTPIGTKFGTSTMHGEVYNVYRVKPINRSEFYNLENKVDVENFGNLIRFNKCKHCFSNNNTPPFPVEVIVEEDENEIIEIESVSSSTYLQYIMKRNGDSEIDLIVDGRRITLVNINIGFKRDQGGYGYYTNKVFSFDIKNREIEEEDIKVKIQDQSPPSFVLKYFKKGELVLKEHFLFK